MYNLLSVTKVFFFLNRSISPKMYRQLRESLDTEQRHLFLAAGSLPDPTTPPPGLIPPLTGTFLTTWHVWPEMSRGFVWIHHRQGSWPMSYVCFHRIQHFFPPFLSPAKCGIRVRQPLFTLLESSHRCEWVSAEKLRGYTPWSPRRASTSRFSLKLILTHIWVKPVVLGLFWHDSFETKTTFVCPQHFPFPLSISRVVAKYCCQLYTCWIKRNYLEDGNLSKSKLASYGFIVK